MKLSVNVNKVATLRNSRGGALPSVVDAVRVCLNAGAPGITVRGGARSNSTSKETRVPICSRWCGRSGRTSARWCRCAPAR